MTLALLQSLPCCPSDRSRLSLASADGPERLSGDWWRADAYARDYWRCVAEGEGELLLYHEAGSQWSLQGWYD